jgi:XTP/dITP diphosphohydrolase
VKGQQAFPRLTFVTSNVNKFAEAEKFLANQIKLVNNQHSRIEIQANTLEEVASYSLDKDPALSAMKLIFLEDAGLFIDALNGFPGPYSAYVLVTVGCQGILKLMTSIENRSARFESVIAFRDSNGKIHLFKGVTHGRITFNERGTHWGFDPIFIPYDENRTYAELGSDKKFFNHRVKSLSKLLVYLKKRYNIIGD